MKFNYKFQNLLGTVYRRGDIIFTNDGNCVISPVGNKITIYNLKHNKSNTLPVESHFNYTAIDVSPNGSILLAINEKGEAQMISLLTCTVIHRYKFKQQVNAVKFSPDGKLFAACCEQTVFLVTQYDVENGHHSSANKGVKSFLSQINQASFVPNLFFDEDMYVTVFQGN